MKKIVRLELKLLEEIALDGDIEVIEGRKHYKWRWWMLDINENMVRCQVTVPKTPSCARFREYTRCNIRRQLRDKNICIH